MALRRHSCAPLIPQPIWPRAEPILMWMMAARRQLSPCRQPSTSVREASRVDRSPVRDRALVVELPRFRCPARLSGVESESQRRETPANYRSRDSTPCRRPLWRRTANDPTALLGEEAPGLQSACAHRRPLSCQGLQMAAVDVAPRRYQEPERLGCAPPLPQQSQGSESCFPHIRMASAEPRGDPARGGRGANPTRRARGVRKAGRRRTPNGARALLPR
jgi:hypothetical protein